MSTEDTILSVEHLNIGFDDFKAVRDLSFGLKRNKVLAVVGESGSGKSMTALSIIGLLPRNARATGEITLRGAQHTRNLPMAAEERVWQQIRGNEIGMVFQEPMSSLNPIVSVGKQLAEAIRLHQNISKAEARAIAIEWLGKVQLPLPEKIYDRFPHELSGGQKQRVMIAMAMCNHPAVLIADEPTTALDVTVQQEILRLMAFLQQEYGTAMIFITHDLALAAHIADDMLVMYKGEAVEYGTQSDILREPKHEYTRALLASKPSGEHKGRTLPTVEDILRGRDTSTMEWPEISTTNEELLKVENLKVWFAEETNLLGKATHYFKAVDDVSFEIKKGEVMGLVGESGCGKSTVSKALVGLLPVNEGRILFKGKDLANAGLKEWRLTRRQIQMIFQDPYGSLNPRMTIGDAIKEPLLVHKIVSVRHVDKEVKRLLGLVQLPEGATAKYPHQFSGGQRQRIGIARALALRPELLICDESVSALDVSIQAQILNLLKELQQEFGLTYLFISHDLNVVHYISDRVMVMQAGKIVERGDAEQVLKHPQDAYTKRLIDAMV